MGMGHDYCCTGTGQTLQERLLPGAGAGAGTGAGAGAGAVAGAVAVDMMIGGDGCAVAADFETVRGSYSSDAAAASGVGDDAAAASGVGDDAMADSSAEEKLTRGCDDQDYYYYYYYYRY